MFLDDIVGPMSIKEAKKKLSGADRFRKTISDIEKKYEPSEQHYNRLKTDPEYREQEFQKWQKEVHGDKNVAEDSWTDGQNAWSSDKHEMVEAGSPAQQAAIAVAMKRAGKKPKQADEAYTPSPAKPFRNPPGFNKQGTGVGNKLAQQTRAELANTQPSKGTPVPAKAFAQGVLKDLKKVNVKDQGVAEEFKGNVKDTELKNVDPANHSQGEGNFVKNQLHSMKRVITHLDNAIGREEDLPDWVQSEIAQAADKIIGVMNYSISSKEQDIEKHHGGSALMKEVKADPAGSWVVYSGGKVVKFKTHTGAKAYAEKSGGKVASSEFYADKIQKQGVAEGYNSQFKSKEQAVQGAKERVKTFRDHLDGIEIWAMPDGGFDQVHTMNANGRNHCIANGGKKIGTIYPSTPTGFKEQEVFEAETDYSKRRQRERDVDAGKPVAKQRQSKMTDYQKRRAEQKRQEALGEMDKSQKGPAGWNLDDYDYGKGKWTQGKIVKAKDAVKDMHKELDVAFNTEPKSKKPVKESYWTKLQNERNTKLNSLVDELKESIKK